MGEQQERSYGHHWGTISIDEMKPVYSTDGDFVTLTSEHFSQAMKLEIDSDKDLTKNLV